MSRMIPQETINALRQFNNVTVDLYGINVKLLLATNMTQVDPLDVYAKPSDFVFSPYVDQKVFIEWNPNSKRLRKLGIFSEDETPIIAWFKLEPVVTVGSYIEVETQYVPIQFDTDKFDIVDIFMKQMHDAELLRCVKLAPRRVK